MDQYELTLYVTGRSANSERAIANLQRIGEEELAGRYKIAVIDVLEQPELAEDNKILATPTLIKTLPPPGRRVIGDLTDKKAVLQGLDIFPEVWEQERSQL